MPVIAVASIYMGGAALAAGGLTAFGTIAAIGSIVGGIGALTGNKTMMKIGAVAGLAGGIGAFAQSQGWMATGGAVAAEQGLSNTQAMANTTSSLVENVAPTVDAGMGAAGAAGEAVTQGISDATAAASGTGGMEIAGLDAAGGLNQSITQANPLLEQGGGLMNAGAQEPVSSLVNPTNSLGGGTDPAGLLSKPQLDGTNVFGANSAPGALDVAGSTGSNKVFDVIGKFGDLFKNKDGSLNKDMVKMAGDFVGGAFDSRKAAETDFLEARSEEIRQQMANANDVPNGRFRNKSRGPLFKPGQPTYRAPRIGGLMNAR
jgi:hypothetical protein